MASKIDQQYKEKLDLEASCDQFKDLLNSELTAIISSIMSKCDGPYTQQMHKIVWANFVDVKDVSPYIKQIN